MSAVVSALWLYPVKSCRGVAVRRARVERRGFADDRRYMIVDHEGRFVTQRTEHRLALVDVAIEDATLRLGEIRVPRRLDSGERVRVTVWRSECDALLEPTGSDWLSSFLGRPVRLVYMPDDVVRAVNPERGQPGDQVSFADGYPFLLASEESLVDLNARLDAPIDMRRFRPNIVISGVVPFAEDSASPIRLGELSFRNVKPCERCVVTTIDPDTGEGGKEPLKTLAGYRDRGDGPLFGVNLIPDSEGEIAVGDPVELCEASGRGAETAVERA